MTDVSVSSEQGTFYIHDDPVVHADRGNRFTEAIHHHTMRIDATVAYRRYEGSGASRYVGADGSMACYRLKQATMSDDEIRIIYEI